MDIKTNNPVTSVSPEAVASAYAFARFIQRITLAPTIVRGLTAVLRALCPVVRSLTGRSLPLCSARA